MPGWTDFRCACINPESELLIDSSILKQYENCDPRSDSCFVDKN